MGAIQSSVNTVLGTAAIAAAAGKHAMEQSDANAMKKAELSEAAAVKGEEITQLQSDANKILEENPVLGTPGEAEALALEEAEGGEDLAMAKRALSTLSEKIAAKSSQREAIMKSFANVGKSPIQRLFGGKK